MPTSTPQAVGDDHSVHSHQQRQESYPKLQAQLDNYPPLLKRKSWTRMAPFKEEKHQRSPSNSIGNNYSPRSAHLDAKLFKPVANSSVVSGRPSLSETSSDRRRSMRLPSLIPLPEQPGSRPVSPISRRRKLLPAADSFSFQDQESAKRYQTYLDFEIPVENLVEIDDAVWLSIQSRIPRALLKDQSLSETRHALRAEVRESHQLVQRQAVVNYILLDVEEQKRLRINGVPKQFVSPLARAPVEWHARVGDARRQMELFLFRVDPSVLEVQRISEKYSLKSIIDSDKLSALQYPMAIDEFANVIKGVCADFRANVMTEWWDEMLKSLSASRSKWYAGREKSPEELDRFFGALSNLTSQQVRMVCQRSFQDFARLFAAILKRQDQLSLYPMVADDKIVLRIDYENIASRIMSIFDDIRACLDDMPAFETRIFKSRLKDEKPVMQFNVSEDFDASFAQCVSALESHKQSVEAALKGADIFCDLIQPEFKPRLVASLDKGGLDEMSGIANELSDFQIKIREYPDFVVVHSFRLNCVDLKGELKAIVNGHFDYLSTSLRKANTDRSTKLELEYQAILSRLQQPYETTEQLMNTIKYSEDIQQNILPAMAIEVNQNLRSLRIIMQTMLTVEEDFSQFAGLFHWPERISPQMKAVRDAASSARGETEKKLRDQIGSINDRCNGLSAVLNKIPAFAMLGDSSKNLGTILQVDKELIALEIVISAVNGEESLLGLAKTTFPSHTAAAAALEPYKKLWTMVDGFFELEHKCMSDPFDSLDPIKVEEQVSEMFRSLYSAGKSMADATARKVADSAKEKVEKFRTYLPLVQTLCNPGLKDRHWRAASELAGFNIRPGIGLAFSQLLTSGILTHVPALAKISETATREIAFENTLQKMKDAWAPLNFESVEYRDTGTRILSSVDDMQTLLDDQIVKVQSMRGSPFVKHIEDDISAWEKRLNYIQDLIDVWLQVQVTWLYLEPIFASEDIVKQMPKEAQLFKNVDSVWRAMMKRCAANPNAIAVSDDTAQLGKLRDALASLEEVQKGLNNYLEMKRLFFPRFFFLSNDELLEILSETKDPTRVQPHLKKCFEGISALNFRDGSVITAMISSEKEEVPFKTEIDTALARGAVEKWLLQVEAAMKVSVQDHVKRAVAEYKSVPRDKFVLDGWPGQVVLSTTQIYWTLEVEEAMKSPDKNSLKNYRDVCTRQLEDIATLVRGKLSGMARATLSALCVIDVHARDLVADLETNNVRDVEDFDWTSQLRYYWKNNDVNVQMMNASIGYGYEYLGNSGRLVITPLTDRCYRTVISALDMTLFAGPEGPAGTGKTETTKDLAKALAKHCVVFNCSDGLDYIAMGKFFKGLAAAGAWACFDEFNRIELEVLSVVAQQVLTIQRAIAAKVSEFNFEGTKLNLNPGCAVFITMNPGYAGRSELPDNLKALFRPVAMMVPDYTLIAEISLYSSGYVHARALSRKIVATFRLCSEQLSSQDHYDYGMRAVKAVLVAAGNLKIKQPDVDEQIILLRSIYDTNLSKFLQQDVPLFRAITSDLFPGITLPAPDYGGFIAAIEESLLARKMQVTPNVVDKIVQTFEMMRVRHGFMLVGEPDSGKSTCVQILKDALELSNARKLDVDKPMQYQVINPKAITMGQLYGQFDPVTHEWSDGVIANVFRDFTVSPEDRRKWVIFDGPVDAIWIENMNTVLDDNKKLCLTSGEIIQLTSSMSVVFEVRDLAVASPATVSRCGMIFFEPGNIGWEARYKSWLLGLPEKVTAEQIEMLKQLCRHFIPDLIVFNDSPDSKSFVSRSENEVITGLANMIDCQIYDMLDISGIVNNEWIPSMFVFAIIWSFGIPLQQGTRDKWEVKLRELVKSCKIAGSIDIPDGSVFDYNFVAQGSGRWSPWMANTEVTIPANAPLDDIIISTIDTVRYTYIIQLLMRYQKNICVVGPSGTGKSAYVTDLLLSNISTGPVPIFVNFSARTSANQTQDLILSKLDKRRKGVMGPAGGKKAYVFVDDLNMPLKEKYGAQPPIELLRQAMDVGFWYDLKDTSVIKLVDTNFITAMAPPGGGRAQITPRAMRHMHLLAINEFSDVTMMHIFSSILKHHFRRNSFASEIESLTPALVQGTLSIYKEVSSTLLPTPAKSHYIFNLRDISRVIKGILLMPADSAKTKNDAIKTWCHEIYRIFYDRLSDTKDRDWFYNILTKTLDSQFSVTSAKLFPGLEEKEPGSNFKQLVFSGLAKTASSTTYTEVKDPTVALDFLNERLDEYNTLSKKPLDLVIFKYAMQHISRIMRVFKQQGHILLVGVGGSGRQSLAKVASFLMDFKVFQIELSRTYSVVDWKEDLKKITKSAGVDGVPTVFLFNDTQVKYESFLEDLNNLLNTGEVPNLFANDEKASISEKMSQVIAASGEPPKEVSPVYLFNYFVQRCRRNLHIVLCMSPVGDSFRNRLRLFPSIVNCCTIDLFEPWPADALERVASKYLEDVKISPDERIAVSKLCQMFHRDAVNLCDDFYARTRRQTYVTPTFYLDLLKTFKDLLEDKRGEVLGLKNRYQNGLIQLESAASQVSQMQIELNDLRPVLIKTTAETEEMITVVARESVEVEKKQIVVKADEAAANVKAAAAKAIKDECEADLSLAIPALEAALSALDTLKPADITVVKSMKNPPKAVKTVMEAICIMKDVKPARIKDADGKMADDFWGPAQKMMGDSKFLQSLKEFDKDNIPAKIIGVIRAKYLPNEDFVPEIVKNSSSAAEGLCKWVLALEIYDRVAKVVAPKKEALKIAEMELEAEMTKLRSKQAELKEVQDKLAKLKDTFEEMNNKKISLEKQVELVGKKLMRAEQLIGGLGGEKDRWTEAVELYKAKLVNVTGDILISAAVIAYLGPYTAPFRNAFTERWPKLCIENGIPCSVPFSFTKTLEEPVLMRSWIIDGLPDDNFSKENALIQQKSRRYPLFIDPQNQANRWIRNMEKSHNLVVIKLTSDDYVRQLENAIQFGKPVLLENIGEEIDSVLEPLLSKQFVKQGSSLFIQLGDALIEVSKDFRFYITTKLRNPHYLPELSAKVTCINFMITPEGLQDQLLGIVSAREKPALEENRNKLIIQSAENKKQLKQIEDRILEILSSGSNILEDETAVSILSSSKKVADDVFEKQKISEATEAQINVTRMGYQPVSKHATILFFVVSNLANIDNMYQNSLPWFINLYEQSIEQSGKTEVLETRVANLNKFFTLLLYRNICQSIFKKDKLLFSFLLATSLAKDRGEISEGQWNFLITGGMAQKDGLKSSPVTWLSLEQWREIEKLLSVAELKFVPENMQTATAEWQKLFESAEPHGAAFPAIAKDLPFFLRLLVLKVLRPDKLVPAVSSYVKSSLGDEFTEPPPFNLAKSYGDSKHVTPLMFILSPGADPTASLYTFASKQGIGLESISMGQGQGVIAERLIEKATREGSWILLQNCHLATSWMSTLEKISEDLSLPNVNPRFRLWLTTYPSDKFPVSILQNSIKLVNEPPNGLKANMMRCYQSDVVKDDLFKRAATGNDLKWRRFLYSLCFFHAVIQERKAFGPLGWNIPYEFNETDLSISAKQLYKYLTTTESVPLKALRYITGECNYGGRCTDGIDRRLLMSLVNKYYSLDVMKDDFKFTEDGLYTISPDTDLNGYLAFIENLPSGQSPGIFGIHENGLIVKDLKETRSFLDTLLLTQSQFTSGGSAENPAIDLAETILKKIPADFDVPMIRKKFPVTYEESMNTVLTQEVIRFTKLLRQIRTTLQQTIRGLKGLIVLSADLEKVAQTMILGKVPDIWLSCSYPTMRGLQSYVSDLVDRCQFFQKWIAEGTPLIFNISAFFFTQAFLTGVMQNYARKVKKPIDVLCLNVNVLTDTLPTSKPSEGAYVKGLCLEGARWDREKRAISEAIPKQLNDPIPVLHLVPGEISAIASKEMTYSSPVYRTSDRRGVLSTTGHSTNFVMMMNLPSSKESSHWVHRGVALFLESNAM